MSKSRKRHQQRLEPRFQLDGQCFPRYPKVARKVADNARLTVRIIRWGELDHVHPDDVQSSKGM